MFIIKRLMLIARVPGLLREKDIVLRPLRIWDGPFLSRALMKDDILSSCGLTKPLQRSWFSFYRRLRRMFSLAYRIEYASEVIGFIGLYNHRPDRTAEMSLAIFEPSYRRMGVGTTAFRLLSSALEQNHVIRKWFVSVRKDNVPACSLCRKLAFENVSEDGDTIRMALLAPHGRHEGLPGRGRPLKLSLLPRFRKTEHRPQDNTMGPVQTERRT